MSYHPVKHNAKHKVSEMRGWEFDHAFHWAIDEDGCDEAMEQAWEESGYYSWPLQPEGWDTCQFFRTWEMYVKPAFVQIMIDKWLSENPPETNTPEEVNQ
jgi:hypothetical protein